MNLPAGKIGNVQISRLICGSNPIIGSAHDRDLIYIAALMRQYFTDRRIMDLWRTCEECGVNTMIGPVDSPYGFGAGSDPARVQGLSPEGGRPDSMDCTDLPERAETSPDRSERPSTTGPSPPSSRGASRMAGSGPIGSTLLVKAIEFIKSNGLIAGCACHGLEVPTALEKAGVELDFYMKTLHSDNYWSATPKAQRPKEGLPPHDNMWCTQPEETIEFMRSVKKPWIAFKVLAAGAIHPREGFRFAFENGADFVNVGMFDFQVRENAILADDIVAEINKKGRSRPWMG